MKLKNIRCLTFKFNILLWRSTNVERLLEVINIIVPTKMMILLHGEYLVNAVNKGKVIHMTSKKKEKPNRRKCEECKSSKALSEFYNADKMFFPSGKLHLCKDCVVKIADENGHDGLLGLLRMLDKPLYQDLYKGDVRDYVRMMNSMPQYRKVGFSDSDTLRELNSVNSLKIGNLKELSEDELKESEMFWGKGLEEDAYVWLNNQWAEYNIRYEVDSLTMENLLVEICLTRLDIRQRRAKGQDVDKQIKTLNDLMTAANIKPVQETGANSVEQETFGTLIKKWENERPIPEPSPEWKDVDNIGKYIRTFFLGHMARMFNKENVFQEEYEEEMSKYTVSPPKEND